MDYETLASRGFQIGGRPLGADASYDAASTGRRLKNWQPGSPGPTRAAVSQLTTVRARSRDAVRNNGWISNGVGNWVSNEVGTGVKPRSSAPDKAFADAANKLWELCAKELDYDGQLDVYGLMAMAVRSRKEAGECFVKIHHLGLNSGNLLPIQFQIIEGEQVPHTLNETRADREIIAGVEFQGGKRAAYWMHPRHPNDSAALVNNMPIAVAARDVIHHFAPLRAGQVRGVAETVQALIKAKDFDEYDDAELTRKKTRADYTGVIKRQNFEETDWEFDPFTGDPLERDGNSAVVNMQPGTFPALLPGEEIQLFDGDQGGGYGDYMRQQLMGVAASLGIPYELLSGDMRNVNDRILRAILNEYHRRIEQSQWLYTIPQLCQGMWNAFIDAAVLVGLLKAPDYAERRREYLQCDWRPHAWAYLHPVQDIQGKLMEIGGGVNSRQAVVAARGYDVEEVDAQNAADAKRARDMGLSYTHDPVPIKDEEPESNQ